MTRFLIIILSIVFILFENCICMDVNPGELQEAIRNKNISIICLRRKLPHSGHIFPFTTDKIDENFTKIEEKTNANHEQWTLVAFSECFFGEINPLGNNEVNYIVRKCNELTDRNKKVIIHINFLHTFNNASYGLDFA